MKIAAIPLKIAWADPEENLAKVESLLNEIDSDTDIVVLPELFSTGFMLDTDVMSSLAETISGPTIERISGLAKRHNVAIVGSFLYKSGAGIYNRAFFIEPSGEETYYDKRHLFSLSSEHTTFTPGTSLPPVVRFRGWNVAMIVCYDLRFPVWCRNDSQRYDIMFVPANWPTSRGFAWKQLLSARAIENQAVYVGANRGGTDDFGDYDGLTIICDGLGKTVSQIDESTGIVYATFQKSDLEQIRTKLPFGNDADDFKLELSQ